MWQAKYTAGSPQICLHSLTYCHDSFVCKQWLKINWDVNKWKCSIVVRYDIRCRTWHLKGKGKSLINNNSKHNTNNTNHWYAEYFIDNWIYVSSYKHTRNAQQTQTASDVLHALFNISIFKMSKLAQINFKNTLEMQLLAQLHPRPQHSNQNGDCLNDFIHLNEIVQQQPIPIS